MNVYATNRPESGYEFQGSFASEEEARKWLPKGATFTDWWTDEEEGEDAPEWTNCPAWEADA